MGSRKRLLSASVHSSAGVSERRVELTVAECQHTTLVLAVVMVVLNPRPVCRCKLYEVQHISDEANAARRQQLTGAMLARD